VTPWAAARLTDRKDTFSTFAAPREIAAYAATARHMPQSNTKKRPFPRSPPASPKDIVIAHAGGSLNNGPHAIDPLPHGASPFFLCCGSRFALRRIAVRGPRRQTGIHEDLT